MADKKFTLPADLSKVDDLTALRKEAKDAYSALVAIPDEEITDDQVEEMTSLADAIEAIDAHVEATEAAAAERAKKIADAKARINDDAREGEEPGEGDAEPGEGDEGDDAEGEQPGEGEQAPADAAPAPQPVAAGLARRAAAKAPKVPAKAAAPLGKAIVRAGAEIPNVAMGSAVEGMGGISELFQARVEGLPKVGSSQKVTNRFQVASIRKEVPEDHRLVSGELEKNMEKINAASRRASQRPALTAGGGWCAPSQYVYDLCALETVSGILDIPEVVLDRGGIQFTKGPDFADIYTDSGFLQTEAQAEAETEKNFIDVECPEFTEVRLDAIGFGVRAGILTNRTYPELVRRYVEGVLVAHAHKVNAAVISRIATALGAAVNLAEYGSAYSDTLQGLEMQAMRLRYKYRLPENAPIEGAAPVWLKSVLRADLSYRMGVDSFLSISDAQIDQHLRDRGISLQWVFDYQDLTDTGVTWPNTVDVLLWTPGAYVKGTLDVIRMDAVYDTAGLKTNTFTAAFFEEGLAVFNPCGSGVKAQLTLGTAGNQALIRGAVGYPSIGAGEGVSFAPAAP